MGIQFINNGTYILDPVDVTYLNDILLNDKGELQVVSYEEIKDIPQEHISIFCGIHGFYCIPTTELIDFLKEEIKGKTAIEIGSGNGVLCRELGIIGTDNFQQLIPKYKKEYERVEQAIVPYGKHVEKLSANDAVKKYKPNVVIAAWCTHKYNPRKPELRGNEIGIDENKILKSAKYIHIGNVVSHKLKPILSYPHRVVKAEWLISRSIHRNDNVIWIWEK